MPFTPRSTAAAVRRRPPATIFGLLLLAAGAAQADAPQQRRLVLQVEMSRQGEVQSGAERGQQRLRQAWTVSAVLASDGVPMATNPLDPDDLRRQAEAAERIAATPARPAPPAAPVDTAALQARAQALMARCGADRDCLMREASALSAAQVARGDAALQARLQAPRPAEPVADDGPAEPYRVFHGTAACRLEVGVHVDSRTEGRFNDVQGVVPFTETAQADEQHRGDAACPTLQAVLDTRSGRLWTHLALLPQDARGSRTREERGRPPRRSDGRVALQWQEAQPALQQRLARLDARGGTDVQRLPVPGGQLELRVQWRFEPI